MQSMNKQKIHSAIKITVLVCKCTTATKTCDRLFNDLMNGFLFCKCGCVVAHLSAEQWVSAQIHTYSHFIMPSINLWWELTKHCGQVYESM